MVVKVAKNGTTLNIDAACLPDYEREGWKPVTETKNEVKGKESK